MKKRSNPKIEAMRERSLMVESERQNYNRKYSLNEQNEKLDFIPEPMAQDLTFVQKPRVPSGKGGTPMYNCIDLSRYGEFGEHTVVDGQKAFVATNENGDKMYFFADGTLKTSNGMSEKIGTYDCESNSYELDGKQGNLTDVNADLMGLINTLK